MLGVYSVRRKPPNNRKSSFENYFPTPDFVKYTEYTESRVENFPAEPYDEEEAYMPHYVNSHLLTKKWLTLALRKIKPTPYTIITLYDLYSQCYWRHNKIALYNSIYEIKEQFDMPEPLKDDLLFDTYPDQREHDLIETNGCPEGIHYSLKKLRDYDKMIDFLNNKAISMRNAIFDSAKPLQRGVNCYIEIIATFCWD